MNRLDLKNLKEYKDFLIIDKNNYKIVFTTANGERSFDKHTLLGIEALNSLKKDFGVEEVIYTSQVHSNDIVKYSGEDISSVECDGIVTDIENIAIGAFTADCVPIILINEEKGVISSIHSGWKGTINGIVKEALDKLEKVYECDNRKTLAYIGPHNRVCCYEVSEELKQKFLEETKISEADLFIGRKLSLEKVIERDLLSLGVIDENIYSLPLCTYCSEDVKLHSYRKSEGTYGRLFTFVIKN